jgi:hypothetical protein
MVSTRASCFGLPVVLEELECCVLSGRPQAEAEEVNEVKKEGRSLIVYNLFS